MVDSIESRVHAELQAAGVLATVWGKILIEAAKRGDFTDAESNLAANWVTCACGRVAAEISVNDIGKPLDHLLSNYGANFSQAIDRNQPINAARSLVLIEARAIELTEQHGITQEDITD